MLHENLDLELDFFKLKVRCDHLNSEKSTEDTFVL